MKSALSNLSRHVVLGMLAIVQIAPIAVMVINSLRSDTEIKAGLIGWPSAPVWDNYAAAWVKGQYGSAFVNSILIGILVSLLVVACNAMASYAMTKLNIYGHHFFTAYFISALAIPSFAIMVPLYFVFQKLGLVNTHAGIVIILAALNIPFTLLFLRAFFLGIPKELEEAAKIDGCSEFRAFTSILLPLAKPIVSTVILIVFVATWNEFLFSNTFLQSDALRTVSLRFYHFQGKYSSNLAYIFTAGCMTLAPIAALFLGLQRSFIDGMMQGGLKG